jgi:hypothetical protein
MNNSAQNKNHSLMEAYYAVYDEDIKNKLNEEKEIKEFLEVIDFLIEDGYDLSEYTYEELYEYHITERWGALLGGAARGIGTLLKKSGGQIYQGAKEPAKKVLTKLGKLAVPTAIAAGLDQYFSGGKGREWVGAGIQGIRQMGHSMPTPGQAADAFKAPETTKPTPSRRNLPPAHLTQSYSYRKNNIITEDPAFPSQKPKGGDWSKLTIGGITKLWDPETNSYQLPGTINKRLKSQGEKEITVPGKAPTPSPAPAPEAPKPSPAPAPTPTPSPTPTPTPSPAPKPATPPASSTPSRPSSSATASTADKIKSGMDVYNKQRSSGDFKSATETGRNISALKYGSPEERKAKTIGTTNPLLAGGDIRRMQQASQMRQKGINVTSSQIAAAEAPKPTPATPNARDIAARASVANVTAPSKPATPTPTPAAPKPNLQQTIRANRGLSTIRSSYEYDAYDLVLEYLLSEGHVDTVEEAHYVMLVMDAEMIGDIVEGSGVVTGAAGLINAVMKPANQTPEEGREAVRKVTRALDTVAIPAKKILSPIDNSKKAQQQRMNKRRP